MTNTLDSIPTHISGWEFLDGLALAALDSERYDVSDVCCLLPLGALGCVERYQLLSGIHEVNVHRLGAPLRQWDTRDATVDAHPNCVRLYNSGSWSIHLLYAGTIRKGD